MCIPIEVNSKLGKDEIRRQNINEKNHLYFNHRIKGTQLSLKINIKYLILLLEDMDHA